MLSSNIIKQVKKTEDFKMTKKIRLIDEPDGEKTATEVASTNSVDSEQLMKYLEAIDWKLWELLKVARTLTGEDK